MRLRIALTGLPFVGLVVGSFPANRVEPYVLGLPFLLFWTTAWVVGCAAIMAIIGRLDDRQDARGEQS